MLPFTSEVFFSVFEQYNQAIWPAQIVAYGLGLAVALLTLWPVAGGGRIIAAILAVFWVWMGVAYHLMHFATVNFAAPAFGAVFIVQGLLLGWTGVIRGKVNFRFRPDASGWSGLGLVIFAIVLYPLLGWVAGHGWPRAQMFGVAPSPTTIFTMGALLLVAGRTPLHLVAIPVLWALIGGTAVWLLNVPEDLAPTLAGIGGLALILWKDRREKRR
jgi:hypothetical protein